MPLPRTFLRPLALLSLSALLLAAGRPAEKEFGDDLHYFKADDAHQKPLDALVGKPMPALTVAEWTNGEVTPDAMKGKVLLIDVWATWCGPCRQAIPHNNKLAEEHKDDLVIVGVCSNSRGQEKLADVVKSDKIAYPVCKDPTLATAKAYAVSFYPTYIAIDRNGIVRAAGLRPDAVDKVIDKLIAEKSKAAN